MTRVLIIEDEPAIAMILKIALREEGYEVTTASDGLAGLEMLSLESVPDLVLADLNMPGLDGRGVVEFMRSSPRLSQIPVVIISGCPEDSGRYPPKGTYDFCFRKPFDLHEVMKTVEVLVRRRKQLRVQA